MTVGEVVNFQNNQTAYDKLSQLHIKLIIKEMLPDISIIIPQLLF